MTAAEALQRGDLAGAVQELQQQVRARPQDLALRVFLFQLYSVCGQWERSLKQLEICEQLDPATEMMTKTYTAAIRCELLREEVFQGRRTPLVLGHPDPWIASMIQAFQLQSKNHFDAAEQLRQQAFEAAPASSGTLTWRHAEAAGGESLQSDRFEWLADAELTLGPILEALLDGRYYWVPFKHVQAIRIEPPTDLRDLVWLPVQFTWVGGGQQLGFIPSRYLGSATSDDDAIRLARKTVWESAGEGPEGGRGQRLIATDLAEYPLLDIREIQIDAAEESHGG